jgi:hypothetical protein
LKKPSISLRKIIKDKVLDKAGKIIKEEDEEVIVSSYSAENHIVKKVKDSTTTSVTNVPSEIILEREKTINLNERLAGEIRESGIECKAIPDIGSLQIEKGSCYSYLFPMSPRIVTNRGCIKIDENSGRNIDLIQIIQKN